MSGWPVPRFSIGFSRTLSCMFSFVLQIRELPNSYSIAHTYSDIEILEDIRMASLNRSPAGMED